MKNQGVTLWLTGLSGSGKTTIAEGVKRELKARSCLVELLDGDMMRTHLSKELGFSKEDRDTNVRRIGFVASLLSRNGVIAIISAISPYRAVRDEIRSMTENFICSCGCSLQRDVNAAKNILNLAKARVGHTQSNASGVGITTLAGVSLLEQILTMNEESPNFTSK
uniref:SxtO n=1 Tax=Heteroscytonema crispum UCFS10 TaxID=1885250 RepID=A0A3G2KSI6_9CYAN|nr:SxtO [Heteroscytonema crispum UCFS10]